MLPQVQIQEFPRQIFHPYQLPSAVFLNSRSLLSSPRLSGVVSSILSQKYQGSQILCKIKAVKAMTKVPLVMFLLQPVPTCPVGHLLKLGTALEEKDRYGRYDRCFLCLVSIEQSKNYPINLKARTECTLQCKLIPGTGLSSWRCEKDCREGNGECNFNICEDCWEHHGVGKCHF